MHLDRTSRRILGSLLEKRWSTPEQYPLTLNAVVLACNQKSNRDPEMQLEEFLVEGCLRQLRVNGWVTIVERDFGRAVRYAERMTDQLGLAPKEAAVLAELLLRGPQTEQEIQRRAERMVRIDTVEETLALLGGMAARGLVRHLPREVGQRIARWKHLLTPPAEEEGAGAADAAGPPSVPGTAPGGAGTPQSPPPGSAPVVPPPGTPGLAAAPAAQPWSAAPDVAALLQELESLRAEVAALREEITTLRAAAAPPVETPKRPGSPYM